MKNFIDLFEQDGKHEGCGRGHFEGASARDGFFRGGKGG